MELTFARLGLILLAALLALSGSPARGQGNPTTPLARTIEGVATTPDGTPLARATLYLFGLPPGQADDMMLGDQTTVVTDSQGHFTWLVPPSLPPLSAYIGVRSIECYALAADCGTTRFRLAVRPNWHGTDAEGAARDLLRQATRPCQTRWVLGGAHPIFSVVVPDTSTVVLAVRGPDGEPLRGAEVQVVPTGLTMDYKGAVVYTGRTDAAGRLSLRCFSGSLRLQVFVPGLGFGSTGTFAAGPGQSVAPSMPPLAPFARLSGTVEPGLVGPGAAISLDSTTMGENVWYSPRAAVDAAGHWALADMLPGQHRLLLDGGRGEGEPVWVTVMPGEQVGGITVGPKKSSSGTDFPFRSEPEASLAVQGRVTDSEGRPVAGADVYAVGSTDQGQTVLTVKTDAAGAYLIPHLTTGGGRRETSVHLVAHRPGFGLAVGDAPVDPGPAPGMWRDVQKDLVFPEPHAGLTVRVLRDGRPAAGVPVALTAQTEKSLIPAVYRQAARGEAAQALRALLSPSAQTGPDGAARFADLTPGLWDVTANPRPDSGWIPGNPTPPSSQSKGVIVRAGEDSSYTVSLLPPPGTVAFRVQDPDGAPPVVPKVVSLTTALSPDYGTLSLVPEGAGSRRGQFYTTGLFQVTARVGDQPLDFNFLVGPYFEGTALVAVSPATTCPSPVTIPAHPLGPASLRVRLQDSHGQPLPGAVTVNEAFDRAWYAASVDAHGVAVFPDMPQGKYSAAAHIAGRPGRAALDQPGGPLPTDAVLTAGTGQPLPQTVTVRTGEQAAVTFRQPPPGYVRLRLVGPLAAEGNYDIEGRQASEDSLIPFRGDPATGEYLIGPLPPGRRTLHVFRFAPAPVATTLLAGEVAVTVRAGQVVPATLAPHSTADQEALYSSPLAGTVLLSDGKTPARGARAALFLPGRRQPVRMARADVQGRLTLSDFWQGQLRSLTVPPGTPVGPVLVAWLPGTAGAVIVPYKPGRDEGLVLPAAVSLRGRVTVGGQPVLGLPSSFRVRAAYQGRGTLNQVLTVDATAQADGTFTLGGLTPGTYQVQAARDDIWLSGTQTLTVGAGPLPDVTLDIAPPGSPVILRLEDRQGQALSSQEVEIVRPEGPLTAEIWPGRLASDSAGLLRVDGLEAGHHLMRTPGRAGDSVGFEVPAWTPGTPTTCRVVLPAVSPRRGGGR